MRVAVKDKGSDPSITDPTRMWTARCPSCGLYIYIYIKTQTCAAAPPSALISLVLLLSSSVSFSQTVSLSDSAEVKPSHLHSCHFPRTSGHNSDARSVGASTSPSVTLLNSRLFSTHSSVELSSETKAVVFNLCLGWNWTWTGPGPGLDLV